MCVETGISPQIEHLLYGCGYTLSIRNVDKSENIKSSVTGSKIAIGHW